MIEFDCSPTGATTPLPHVWEHTVGCGHATCLYSFFNADQIIDFLL